MNANENVAIRNIDGENEPTRKSKLHGPFIFGDDTLPQDNNDRLSDEEMAELVAELEELKKNDSLEELSLEQMIENARKCYSKIPMFDYGLGKMSNEQAVADFYGQAIVDQIKKEREDSYENRLEDRKPGQISKKLWQRMKDIRAGRLPKAKPVKYPDQCKPKNEPQKEKPEEKEKPEIEVERRERQKGDDYFMTLERGVIRNETYRQLFKGPGTVYEWLWANIVRDQWKDTKAYPIKEKYHDKGYLAYCSTYGKIAKECGMSKNTVRKYIEDFEKAGVVTTELLVPDGKKQGQTVFILGTWKRVGGERVESYYRDSVFITPKPVKN